MNRLPFFFLLVFGLGLVSCQDESTPPVMSVERYVNLLKAGKYDHAELPTFTSQDIPALLSYAGEMQKITNFPTNPISSAWYLECSLGMYVLWTVESIRIRSFDPQLALNSFPSQNPTVEDKLTFEYIEQSPEVQEEVADYYLQWWNTIRDQEFVTIHHIDPLEKSSLRWH